ncbi:restriction endonuclease subunit S [Kocuria rhizophila]|nr:restriction endonuclease subunit S [Kocuria rhizophila]
MKYQGKKSGDLPFFKVSDMNSAGNELFMSRANNYITESRRKSLGAVRVPAGAIVFAKVGAAVFQERKRILAQDSCIDNNMSAFIADGNLIDVRFAHYLLTAFRMSDLVSVGALPSLNGGQLRSIPLLVPVELSEQRRIVNALKSADDLIATLERLIAKTQAIKRGMMQQLLTGRTRLPGFTAEWQSVALGELGVFLKGRGVKRDDVRSSGVSCIRYGELYTGFINYTYSAKSFVTNEVAATALPIFKGDLLFAGSGETRDEIGICVAYVGENAAVAGGDIIVLRGTGFNPIFLATLINFPTVANQKARAGQGDAVVHISSGALSEIMVSIPEKPEQDAIAKVLVDADQELVRLRARLTKARAMKTGMMQQLLTGRVRLPMEASA